MGRASRRAFSLVFLVALAVGCSDDKKIVGSVDGEDASVDAGEDGSSSEKSDAATSGSGGRTGMNTGKPGSCDDLDCASPATCKASDGKASCVCPDGYDDTKGDGSECKDKDECAKSADNDCDSNATCENKPGGYDCKCKGPAYTGDGKSCKCADGYEDKDGACLAPDGNKCEDDLDCTNGNCESGICCAVACNSPDAVCTTAEGATCVDGKTCKYPVSPDGEACDDNNACVTGSTCKAGGCQTGTEPVNCDDSNPCTDDSCDTTLGCRNQNNTNTCDDKNACTSNDKCAGGTCAGTNSVDCSAQTDICNTGACDPANGTCGKKPKADGILCDDANSCTLMDQCSAGTCAGQGDACGPNANSCTPGTPNTCGCKADYLAAGGLCVPTMNECDANPCNANATCFDPSNNAGDVTCKCNAGYEGDGKTTCTATMPCMNNPCGEGRGTCTAGTAGAYTCACAAGYKEVDKTCVCDLSGTFAGRNSSTLSWSGMDGIENGSGPSYEWFIERHNYDADGTLTIEAISCGESALDLCGTGNALIGPEAYTQYVPAQSYAMPSWPHALDTISLKKALPNETYTTPLQPGLVGISLTDPMGPWPADRSNVQGGPGSGSSITNGARWVDVDNDSFIGITNYEVGPGGISAEGDGPRPIVSYGATSSECPRSNPNAARLSYNWPPAVEGLTVRRIKRIYSAYRAISGRRGKIESCDLLTGQNIGPNANDHLRIDGIAGGCVRVNGTGEADCSQTLVDFFQDSNAQSQDLAPSDYVVKRASDDLTCEQVRAMSF